MTGQPIESGEHRSGFAEFQETGRYPLRPGLEDRSAALVLSATTAAALARISARGQVARRVWRTAQAEARKAARS